MECPLRCGETLADNNEIAAHVGDTGSCPLAPVPCLFHNVGTDGCSAQPQRRFFQSHLQRSSAIHQRLLLEGLEKVRERQRQLECDMRQLATDQRSDDLGNRVAAEAASADTGTTAPVQDIRDQLTSLQASASGLSSRVDGISERCSGLEAGVTGNTRGVRQLNLASAEVVRAATVSQCAGCEGLRTELRQLRAIVLDMASVSRPCTSWRVRVDVRMHPDGRLQLLGDPSSACRWSGPAGCGHQVYTSSVLRSLTQIAGGRAAASQVGLVELSVNVIASRSAWPDGEQQLRVSYPDTLLSATQSCVVSLPHTVAVAAAGGDGEGQSAGRSTLRTVCIPVLLPAEAELGATLDWTYEVELCALWAHRNM